MIKVNEEFLDAISVMTYGSPSYKTWKKACDDSLKRSQRRRAEESSPGWTLGIVLLMALVTVTIALLIIGLLTGALL